MTRRNRADRRQTIREQQVHDATIKAVDEFYLEVAHLLDLPRKELPSPPPGQTREEVRRAIRAKPALLKQRAFWLPALAVLLLVVTGAYTWWPAAEAAVPAAFQGTWVSQSPSYAGRMIMISMETVEIVLGRSEATGPLAVTSSKVDTIAAGIRLRVVYGAAGGEQQMELLLREGPPATLTLRRPSDVVWERHTGAPATQRADSAAPSQ